MHPPRKFKFDIKRGYSVCIACGRWTHSNAIFHHEGVHWILCVFDYVDYWENTEEIKEDYKEYKV